MVFSMQEKHELPVLAIDLGGTKLIAAAISKQGQVMARESYLTLAGEGPQSVIDRILSAIDHLISARNRGSSQLDSHFPLSLTASMCYTKIIL